MKFPEQHNILTHYSADHIVKQLSPYVNEQRQNRITQVINNRLKSVQLALECPSDINNAFAAIRTAEALGIVQIHIIAPEGTTFMAKHITRGALYWTSIDYYDTLPEFLKTAKKNNLHLAGGIVTTTTPLSDVPVQNPICIMIGNEHRGLSQAAQEACTIRYTIPMVGMSESMNLSVSAAISLYDVTQRKRLLLNNKPDMSLIEQQKLRAHYFLNSVSQRLSKELFALPDNHS